MKRKTSLTDRQTAAMKAVPEAGGSDGDIEQVVSRPDGYYWIAPDGHQQVGPFSSAEEALDDMRASDGEAPEPGETLQEAESELGIADWIDPDTGDPAEGWSHPRFED